MNTLCVILDFPGNDPGVIQVHITSAKKDIIGSYHVTGEITNEGNDALLLLSKLTLVCSITIKAQIQVLDN
jgi:hypothetical protein